MPTSPQQHHDDYDITPTDPQTPHAMRAAEDVMPPPDVVAFMASLEAYIKAVVEVRLAPAEMFAAKQTGLRGTQLMFEGHLRRLLGSSSVTGRMMAVNPEEPDPFKR